MKNLIEKWAKKFLILEGKYDTISQTIDVCKTPETFNDVDEYEKWMNEREEMIFEGDDEDEEQDEEDEEENLIEQIHKLKEKLISKLEEVISQKEEYDEDEIKNSFQLLFNIAPEKVSDEDMVILQDIE